jgi:hypothetical protein
MRVRLKLKRLSSLPLLFSQRWADDVDSRNNDSSNFIPNVPQSLGVISSRDTTMTSNLPSSPLGSMLAVHQRQTCDVILKIIFYLFLIPLSKAYQRSFSGMKIKNIMR